MPKEELCRIACVGAWRAGDGDLQDRLGEALLQTLKQQGYPVRGLFGRNLIPYNTGQLSFGVFDYTFAIADATQRQLPSVSSLQRTLSPVFQAMCSPQLPMRAHNPIPFQSINTDMAASTPTLNHAPTATTNTAATTTTPIATQFELSGFASTGGPALHGLFRKANSNYNTKKPHQTARHQCRCWAPPHVILCCLLPTPVPALQSAQLFDVDPVDVAKTALEVFVPVSLWTCFCWNTESNHPTPHVPIDLLSQLCSVPHAAAVQLAADINRVVRIADGLASSLSTDEPPRIQPILNLSTCVRFCVLSSIFHSRRRVNAANTGKAGPQQQKKLSTGLVDPGLGLDDDTNFDAAAATRGILAALLLTSNTPQNKSLAVMVEPEVQKSMRVSSTAPHHSAPSSPTASSASSQVNFNLNHLSLSTTVNMSNTGNKSGSHSRNQIDDESLTEAETVWTQISPNKSSSQALYGHLHHHVTRPTQEPIHTDSIQNDALLSQRRSSITTLNEHPRVLHRRSASDSVRSASHEPQRSKSNERCGREDGVKASSDLPHASQSATTTQVISSHSRSLFQRHPPPGRTSQSPPLHPSTHGNLPPQQLSYAFHLSRTKQQSAVNQQGAPLPRHQQQHGAAPQPQGFSPPLVATTTAQSRPRVSRASQSPTFPAHQIPPSAATASPSMKQAGLTKGTPQLTLPLFSNSILHSTNPNALGGPIWINNNSSNNNAQHTNSTTNIHTTNISSTAAQHNATVTTNLSHSTLPPITPPLPTAPLPLMHSSSSPMSRGLRTPNQSPLKSHARNNYNHNANHGAVKNLDDASVGVMVDDPDAHDTEPVAVQRSGTKKSSGDALAARASINSVDSTSSEDDHQLPAKQKPAHLRGSKSMDKLLLSSMATENNNSGHVEMRRTPRTPGWANEGDGTGNGEGIDELVCVVGNFRKAISSNNTLVAAASTAPLSKATGTLVADTSSLFHGRQSQSSTTNGSTKGSNTKVWLRALSEDAQLQNLMTDHEPQKLKQQSSTQRRTASEKPRVRHDLEIFCKQQTLNSITARELEVCLRSRVPTPPEFVFAVNITDATQLGAVHASGAISEWTAETETGLHEDDGADEQTVTLVATLTVMNVTSLCDGILSVSVSLLPRPGFSTQLTASIVKCTQPPALLHAECAQGTVITTACQHGIEIRATVRSSTSTLSQCHGPMVFSCVLIDANNHTAMWQSSVKIPVHSNSSGDFVTHTLVSNPIDVAHLVDGSLKLNVAVADALGNQSMLPITGITKSTVLEGVFSAAVYPVSADADKQQQQLCFEIWGENGTFSPTSLAGARIIVETKFGGQILGHTFNVPQIPENKSNDDEQQDFTLLLCRTLCVVDRFSSAVEENTQQGKGELWFTVVDKHGNKSNRTHVWVGNNS